jgi:hypothetical protein
LPLTSGQEFLLGKFTRRGESRITEELRRQTGTNLRFLVTNGAGRAAEVFAFYNDRGECENRIEEFKNGFRADRLSCHRFLANAFRLLLQPTTWSTSGIAQVDQIASTGRVFPAAEGGLRTESIA